MNPELFHNIPMHPVGAPFNLMSVPVEKTGEDGTDVSYDDAVKAAKERLSAGTTTEWVVVD